MPLYFANSVKKTNIIYLSKCDNLPRCKYILIHYFFNFQKITTMKKTNNNGANATTNAIFNAGMPSATYAKPQTKAVQAVVKYSDIKRGAMVLIDAELRGFNANIKALKANANLPALVELMNADALTFEMFTIEYLQKWQGHRFNANNALCNLVVVTDKNREKLAECEKYTNNGKEVAKVPARAWSVTAFYNMFKAARRMELKTAREIAKAKARAEADKLNEARLRAKFAELQKRVQELDNAQKSE